VGNLKTHLMADERYQLHETGAGHPESPARYAAIYQAFSRLSIPALERNPLPPRLAEKEEILLCHTPGYYDLVEREVKYLSMLSTGDTVICPASFEIALLAAGGVLKGIDAVMEGRAKNVFCLVRPPGHHACSNRGMGFCIFNNVAIGARYLQKTYGLKRLLIVDWDVHHGNGTQEIFEEDPSLFYFSTHQKGLYPGTGHETERGRGEGRNYTLNCPIAPGHTSRIQVVNAFIEQLLPAMEKFQPNFIFISAGFDAHYLDPLGGFNLTDQDFVTLTQIIKSCAEKYAEERIVSVLEGGYHLQALASAASAHLIALSQ
jgi:acetoin utilization deacetylase AcuC-like enzyme